MIIFLDKLVKLIDFGKFDLRYPVRLTETL